MDECKPLALGCLLLDPAGRARMVPGPRLAWSSSYLPAGRGMGDEAAQEGESEEEDRRLNADGTAAAVTAAAAWEAAATKATRERGTMGKKPPRPRNGWDALARLAAGCANDEGGGKKSRKNLNPLTEVVVGGNLRTAFFAGVFVANGREHSVSRVAADVLSSGQGRYCDQELHRR